MTEPMPAETIPSHRQPAYDAVYRIIAACPPRSVDDHGKAYENARVWRAVEAALDAMEATGRMLPAGTTTVEQWTARVTRDGLPVQDQSATTREFAQQRVDYHARMRAENPGWRGAAELVRRWQHTTPWESVPADPHRREYDALLEALGDARIRFWVCPTPGHSERTGPGGQPVLTVEWRGDVAYCTFPDCGRNSQQPATEEKP